jgi:hypothetical protein
MTSVSANLTGSLQNIKILNKTATDYNQSLSQSSSRVTDLLAENEKLQTDRDGFAENLTDCRVKMNEIKTAYTNLSQQLKNRNVTSQVGVKSETNFTVLPTKMIEGLCMSRKELEDNFYEIQACNLLGDLNWKQFSMPEFLTKNPKISSILIVLATFAAIGLVTLLLLICWASLCCYRRRQVVRLPRTDRLKRFFHGMGRCYRWCKVFWRTPVSPIVKPAKTSTPKRPSRPVKAPEPEAFETQELHVPSVEDPDEIRVVAEVHAHLQGTLV